MIYVIHMEKNFCPMWKYALKPHKTVNSVISRLQGTHYKRLSRNILMYDFLEAQQDILRNRS